MNEKYRKKIYGLKRISNKKMQRIFMFRRISAIVVIILIIVLLICGIRSCGNSDISSKAPVVSMVPAQTPLPSGMYDGAGINQNYFDKSCFIGNSVIESMEVYELIDNADYFAKVGLNVTDALTTATDNGMVPVIDELDTDKQYNRIFMMFGENELNWPSIDTFKSSYANLIKKAKKYQPNAKIYILAVTPIAKSIEGNNDEEVTKDAIVAFNDYLKEIAKANNATYADLFDALADSDGYLPEGAATDGIHFGKDYYTKCLAYIQNNYQ